METHKRDFFVARIRAGCIPIQMAGKRFLIHHPNEDIAMYSQEKYLEAYEYAQEEDLLSEQELLDFLIIQGIWSDVREDEYQRIAPGHIEYWKIELFQSTLKSNTRKKVKKYLKAAKEEYERLHELRHHYDYVTIDGYANYIRSVYLIEQCTTLDGKPVDWSVYDVAKVMGKYHTSLLGPDDIRELARTSPWAGLWGVLKSNRSTIFPGTLTVEQQSLMSWSIMYDRINESPDCPSDDVIEDDDMLDGWLLVQKRKRDADRKRQEVESHVNPRIANADEVFVPAETMADAQKIDLLNPQHVKRIKQSRMKQMEEHGTVKEQEFKDVQRKRSMQMQEAFNKNVTGR